jgi:hypothetical protein
MQLWVLRNNGTPNRAPQNPCSTEVSHETLRLPSMPPQYDIGLGSRRHAPLPLMPALQECCCLSGHGVAHDAAHVGGLR